MLDTQVGEKPIFLGNYSRKEKDGFVLLQEFGPTSLHELLG